MKEFVVYTGLRLALFVGCFVVLGGIWWALWGASDGLIIPFLIAMVVSSLLSLKYLQPQREAFAQRVEARASKAAAKFEEIRAREDEDA